MALTKRAQVSFAAAIAAACVAMPAVEPAHAFSNYHAVINSNGTTLRGSGVKSSTRSATGRYNITFTRPVKDCGYIASLATRGSAIASAHPNVSGTILQVFTYGPTGTASNQNFTLIVSCTPELVVRRVDVGLMDGVTAGVSHVCQPGEKVVGGGADMVPVTADTTVFSRPDNVGVSPEEGETFTGWRTTGRNPAGGVGNTTMRAYVLCVR